MPILNTALTLKDLPPPPTDKSGWPWTEQTEPLQGMMTDGSKLPRISIVTPNYNQAQFLEETIRSILLQGYPNLEYVIIDGGSTDNSIEIIKKYEKHLAFWTSEPDRGQSHAINKGFVRCTGDYIAWMNSDDCYMPNALNSTFEKGIKNQSDFIYGSTYLGKELNDKHLIPGKGIKTFHIKNLLRFFYSLEYIIPSQSVLVSKSLFEKVGLLKEELHYCMDLDWFARIALEHPLVYRNEEPICFYRTHENAKTQKPDNQVIKEAIMLAKLYLCHLTLKEQQSLARLLLYFNYYEEYRLEKREKSVKNLLNNIIDLPKECLSDTRFLGMVKSALIKNFVSLTK